MLLNFGDFLMSCAYKMSRSLTTRTVETVINQRIKFAAFVTFKICEFATNRRASLNLV